MTREMWLFNDHRSALGVYVGPQSFWYGTGGLLHVFWHCFSNNFQTLFKQHSFKTVIGTFQKFQTVIKQYLNSIPTVLLLFYLRANTVSLLLVQVAFFKFCSHCCSTTVLSLFEKCFKKVTYFPLATISGSGALIGLEHVFFLRLHCQNKCVW